MTRLIIYFVILSISLNKSVAQPLRNADSLQTKIIIIGDAGGVVKGKQPVVDAVRKNFVLDEKTVVVYLGDNLYHNGLPDEASPYYDSLRAVQLLALIKPMVIYCRKEKLKEYNS